MAFEDTRENLAALERLARPIQAEELYELLGLVMDEAYGFSGVLDASALNCGDPARLAQAARYVLGDAIQAADRSRDGIGALSAQGRQECLDARREAERVAAELDEAVQARKGAEEARARLSEARAQLEREKAELAAALDICGALEARIALLGGASLEETRAERDRLREELSALEREDAALREELSGLIPSVGRLRQGRDAAEQERQAVEAVRDDLERQLAQAEDAVRHANARAEEIRQLLDTLEGQNAALLESAAKYTALFNALNAVLNEPFLREGLFRPSGGGPIALADSPDLPALGREFQSAEELRGWMDAVQERIEALINVYREVLRQAAARGEGLTAPVA